MRGRGGEEGAGRGGVPDGVPGVQVLRGGLWCGDEEGVGKGDDDGGGGGMRGDFLLL